MKQRCVREVSRAVGRPIDGVEAQAIEAYIVRALRQDARDRATWLGRSGPERVLAAGERAAREALGQAVEARRALGRRPPPGRRFAQPGRDAGWIAEMQPQEARDAWRALAQDESADPEALLSHPVQQALEAQAPPATMTREQARAPGGLDGRRYRIDGREFDADGYVAHMRAKFEGQTPVPIRRERTAVIVTGQAGAGKSSTRRALARIYGAASVDLDDLRQGIPEFAGGRGSDLTTQAEAGELRDRVIKSMLADEQNILIETVGGDAPNLAEQAQALRALGYAVHLVNVKASFANSARRYVLRTLNEGRWISADYLRRIGDSPQRAYHEAVAAGGFDGYIQVDANGPQGSETIAHAAGLDAGEVQRALASERSARPGSDADGGAAADQPGAQRGEGERLGQGGGDGRRGETFIPEGGVFADPGVIVSLFETADRSTPLHEFGHVFLEGMHAYAARENAPAQLVADVAAVRAWLGVADGAELTPAHHEQFARGAEAYFREGRAPSPGLESIFAAFKRWLEAIYRSIAELDVELTPEIRAVFDRLFKDPDHAKADVGILEPSARTDRGRAAALGDRPAGARGGAGDDGPGAAGGDQGRGGGRGSRGREEVPAQTQIAPALLARDPELRAIADELAATRAEIDALERQGLIQPEEARAARADLEVIEKASARPEMLRAAAFCLMHGARVAPGAS